MADYKDKDYLINETPLKRFDVEVISADYVRTVDDNLLNKVSSISYLDIENLLVNVIYKYLTEQHIELLAKNEILIRKAAALDFAIRTKIEYAQKKLIPESHSPYRLASFLLNYLGESICVNREFTISYDDPAYALEAGATRPLHINTYKLTFNAEEEKTHQQLYAINFIGAGHYDFKAVCVKQQTKFPANGQFSTTYQQSEQNGKVSTVGKAYDAKIFGTKEDKYTVPIRTVDFKGAGWNQTKAKDTHNADYIIQISATGEEFIYDGFGKSVLDLISGKPIQLSPAALDKSNLMTRYLELYSVIMPQLEHETWEHLLDIIEQYKQKKW